MSKISNTFEAISEDGLFSGFNSHRFVPLNSQIAKQINLSVPIGIYGSIKKDESFNFNSKQDSTPIVMELFPSETFIKSEKSKLINIDAKDKSPTEKNDSTGKNFNETGEFDTIKQYYYDSRYLPNKYSFENNFMKKTSTDYNGEIAMNVLINQASGIMSEEIARNCRATGIGLKKAVAGEITQLMIYSYSEDNKRITYGGYNFRLLLTPYKFLNGFDYQEQFSNVSLELLDINETFEGSIIDNNNGTYTASYICKKAVPHKLEIIGSKNKKPIGGSPFIVHVYPGKAYPKHCWAYGEGLQNYNLGETISSFKINSVDRMGNRTKCGGDKYEVYGIGGIKIQQILDLKNGEYEVYYKVNQCNIDDYKEINIKLHGKDIKTPVFYPKPKISDNEILNAIQKNESGENKLLNKTALKFDNLSIDFKPAYTLSMVFKDFEEMKKMGNEINITIPHLVPFPENKENENLKEITCRIENMNETKDIQINDKIILNNKARSNALENYKNNTLKYITNKLLKHEDILNDLSNAIIMHCEKGKEHDEKLSKDEKKLESELDEITDCQQRMFATYSCLQQGGIDSLPVSFELEDPEKVKLRQSKDRKFYVDTYNILEKKFEEIKLRKEIFEKNRDDYTQRLHKTLATRQKSIIKAQRSYSKILDELEKAYLHLSKKQIRRQDLYKNLRLESLQVFEGIQNQKIIDKQLKKNAVLMTNNSNEDIKSLNQTDSNINSRKITGKDRRYNSYSCLVPTDPESPAFWFAEASYLRNEKSKSDIGKSYELAELKTDEYSQKIKRWDLDEDSRWISCPSSVSITFSTLKTPELQPIKQKGIFKNDYNTNNLDKSQIQVQVLKKRDPMLPDDMSDEEMNKIIQKEREKAKLNKKSDNFHNFNNNYDFKYLSQWVKNPPKPSNLKVYYDKSLDNINQKAFHIKEISTKIDSAEDKINKLDTEPNSNTHNIDINLINKEVRLLTENLWDKKFMLNLNKDAKKIEDFEKIKKVWENELAQNRDLREKMNEEKIKFMSLLPDKKLKEKELNILKKDENEICEVENNFNENSLDTNTEGNYKDENKYKMESNWRYLHHTFESDPRRVPWEFLDEISKLQTISEKQLSKKELQKYIVSSLVLDRNNLNKKIDLQNTRSFKDGNKKVENNKDYYKKKNFYLGIENQKNFGRKGFKHYFDKNKNYHSKFTREHNLGKEKLIISRKNYDTRREQMENDNYNLFD